MADDSAAAPLPRRVPGAGRGPGARPLTRPALSESDLQRMRAALDRAQDQADGPPAKLPAPLSRRTTDESNGSEPPPCTAGIARQRCRPLRRLRPSPSAVPAPRPGEATRIPRQPDVTAEPVAAAAPATQLVPAAAGGGAGRAQQGQTEEEKASRSGRRLAERKTARKECRSSGKRVSWPGEPHSMGGALAVTRSRRPQQHRHPPSQHRRSRPPSAPAPRRHTPALRGGAAAPSSPTRAQRFTSLSAGSSSALTRHTSTAEPAAPGGGPGTRGGLSCRTGRPSRPGLVRSGAVPCSPGARHSR